MDQPDLFHQVCPRCDLYGPDCAAIGCLEWIAEYLPDEYHRLIAGDIDDTPEHAITAQAHERREGTAPHDPDRARSPASNIGYLPSDPLADHMSGCQDPTCEVCH